MAQPHISLAAEKIFTFAGLPITNSILMTWMVMAFLLIMSLYTSSKISIIPSGFQSILEIIIEGLRTLFKSVVGEQFIDKFFPLLGTIFVFVAVANWAGLLPGVGTLGIKETAESRDVAIEQKSGNVENPDAHTKAGETVSKTAVLNESKLIPLFRGPTADLNTTLAIALVAVFAVQYYGVKTLGITYFSKFFNFSDPIMFGVGLLEIISEVSRIISFAFRLFGNIFAGEVLLTVIAFLMPLFAPLPFIGLELFVGFIQALVFSMLTAVFLNMATVSHERH